MVSQESSNFSHNTWQISQLKSVPLLLLLYTAQRSNEETKRAGLGVRLQCNLVYYFNFLCLDVLGYSRFELASITNAGDVVRNVIPISYSSGYK